LATLSPGPVTGVYKSSFNYNDTFESIGNDTIGMFPAIRGSNVNLNESKESLKIPPPSFH